jgi:hypothetical protein
MTGTTRSTSCNHDNLKSEKTTGSFDEWKIKIWPSYGRLCLIYHPANLDHDDLNKLWWSNCPGKTTEFSSAGSGLQRLVGRRRDKFKGLRRLDYTNTNTWAFNQNSKVFCKLI